MGSYTLTKKAVADLSEIWNYTTETGSEKQSDKYYFMLLDACQELADRKITGKIYPEISAEISGFRTGQHLIFYRIKAPGEIQIIRILHSKMDLKNSMQG